MSDIVERYEKARELWPSTSDTRVELEARNLLADAICEIEALRSLGKAAIGPSFADVVKDMRRQQTTGINLPTIIRNA